MNAKTYSLLAAATIGLAGIAPQAGAASAALPSVVADTGTAQRTVNLGADTTHVNVTYGETVRFVTPGGQGFVVKFDGTRSAVDLNAVAPAGALARPVTAYVTIVGSVLGS